MVAAFHSAASTAASFEASARIFRTLDATYAGVAFRWESSHVDLSVSIPGRKVSYARGCVSVLSGSRSSPSRAMQARTLQQASSAGDGNAGAANWHSSNWSAITVTACRRGVDPRQRRYSTRLSSAVTSLSGHGRMPGSSNHQSVVRVGAQPSRTASHATASRNAASSTWRSGK
jgi:hypothetical protein